MTDKKTPTKKEAIQATIELLIKSGAKLGNKTGAIIMPLPVSKKAKK